MSACDELRAFILKHLMQDIELHEKGSYSEIGRWHDNMPPIFDECAIEDELEAERLLIAENFCDRWSDARNHEWGYYRGVEEKDWPVIARQIYQGIVEKWEPDKMLDNYVFNPPPSPPRISLWQRLKMLWTKNT